MGLLTTRWTNAATSAGRETRDRYTLAMTHGKRHDPSWESRITKNLYMDKRLIWGTYSGKIVTKQVAKQHMNLEKL